MRRLYLKMTTKSLFRRVRKDPEQALSDRVILKIQVNQEQKRYHQGIAEVSGGTPRYLMMFFYKKEI